uniref:Uncharacterized protein n=1 Tax=Panagrolaimus sp. ES5 TaxID=591445 RepID=A0AC34FTE9_9BILA
MIQFQRVIVFSFLFCFSLIQCCEDGVDNVIEIHDILPESQSSVRFKGVKIHTFGADAKPLCKPEIHLPGFIKIAEGEIEVINALENGHDDDLMIDFTVEQNSFMVGKVCEKGKSKNSFVPDEVCSISLCRLAPQICQLLEKEHTLTTDDLPEDQRGLISFGSIAFSALEGEWKAIVRIIQHGKIHGSIRIGDKKSWTSIKLGDEHDNKIFEKTEKKLGIKRDGNNNDDDEDEEGKDEL